MNCKPGDIAISVGSKNAGRLFQILSLAPSGRFYLPNGVLHTPVGPNVWVVKVLDGSIITRFANESTKPVNYGAADDKHLRPLRDPDEAEIEDDAMEWVL